jgi:hypothetical protein
LVTKSVGFWVTISSWSIPQKTFKKRTMMFEIIRNTPLIYLDALKAICEEQISGFRRYITEILFKRSVKPNRKKYKKN